MPTDPLTGSRYPSSSAVPNVNQDIQNAVTDLADNTIPEFSTTTTRDNAYTAWVALGNAMRNGLKCSVNGVPYRRMGGTWRIDRNRNFLRAVSITGGAGSIGAGGSVESGATAGITLTGGSGASFTLYEAGTVTLTASFRAGPTGVGGALCSVKIDGSTVGNVAVSRADGTVTVTGGVALASGAHTVALRVDTSSSACVWTDAALTIHDGTAE